jgi:hypothetical protein
MVRGDRFCLVLPWGVTADRPLFAREADMARMFPAICPTTKDGVMLAPAERQLFARLARELDAGWQIIHHCAVIAAGNHCPLDFILLHRDYGIALLGVARPGESDDPALAVAAMRTMLEEIGFARRYPGNLAVIARRIVPVAVSDLAAFLAVRFATVPVSAIADPTWLDWLMQRLAPEHRVPEREGAASPAAAARGLRAPAADDSWHAWAGNKPRGAAPGNLGEPRAGASLAEIPVVRVAAERIAVSRVAETRSPLWTGMVLSVFVVTVVLVGIAVLSHGNGSSDMMARQSAVSPLPAAPAGAAPATSN